MAGRASAYGSVGFVFGLSFGELVVVVIVAIVVIGPKDLPKVLRKAGQWAGKLRRMAGDLRAQSGIDEVLRTEGLGQDILEIRKLARGEIEGAVAATRFDLNERPAPAALLGADGAPLVEVVRDREYPRVGADGYGALPDDAIVYAETLPRSAFADDPVFLAGIPQPVEPVVEPPPEGSEEPATDEPATEEPAAKDLAAGAPPTAGEP